MFLLKMFLLTRRTQLWQLRQKIFEKKVKIFRSTSKNDIKNIFQGKITSQKILMDTRKQRWLPSRGILAWSRKILPSISERCEETTSSDTNVPPKMFLWKLRLSLWYSRGASSEENRKRFAEWPEMILKLCSISRYFFIPNHSMDT